MRDLGLDTRVRGRTAEVGSRHEWAAEITEQLPDERVAWRNTDGKENAGAVTFHKLDDRRTGRRRAGRRHVR